LQDTSTPNHEVALLLERGTNLELELSILVPAEASMG
jgi:hypothetical protein